MSSIESDNYLGVALCVAHVLVGWIAISANLFGVTSTTTKIHVDKQFSKNLRHARRYNTHRLVVVAWAIDGAIHAELVSITRLRCSLID